MLFLHKNFIMSWPEAYLEETFTARLRYQCNILQVKIKSMVMGPIQRNIIVTMKT